MEDPDQVWVFTTTVGIPQCGHTVWRKTAKPCVFGLPKRINADELHDVFEARLSQLLGEPQTCWLFLGIAFECTKIATFEM